jgi:hypothetical protein
MHKSSLISKGARRFIREHILRILQTWQHKADWLDWSHYQDERGFMSTSWKPRPLWRPGESDKDFGGQSLRACRFRNLPIRCRDILSVGSMSNWNWFPFVGIGVDYRPRSFYVGADVSLHASIKPGLKWSDTIFDGGIFGFRKSYSRWQVEMGSDGATECENDPFLLCGCDYSWNCGLGVESSHGRALVAWYLHLLCLYIWCTIEL